MHRYHLDIHNLPIIWKEKYNWPSLLMSRLHPWGVQVDHIWLWTHVGYPKFVMWREVTHNLFIYEHTTYFSFSILGLSTRLCFMIYVRSLIGVKLSTLQYQRTNCFAGLVLTNMELLSKIPNKISIHILPTCIIQIWNVICMACHRISVVRTLINCHTSTH